MDRLRRKNRPQCGLLIENGRGEVLLQLRDDKPSIPYPNCWGTFGGQIEDGETPEQAMAREIAEELGYQNAGIGRYGTYPCDGYVIHMFRCLDPDFAVEAFRVREGQGAAFFSSADLGGSPFAFNCREIVQEYFSRFHPLQTIYIGLGSNISDREAFLRMALAELEHLISVEAISSIYETEPVGPVEDQPWFLNMALRGSTRLFPAVLLERLQNIEAGLGRERIIAQGPRTIDLDILLYGAAVLNSEHLTVPHPRLHERRFVLEPLAELAPDLVHPVLGRTMDKLCSRAVDGKGVHRRGELTAHAAR